MAFGILRPYERGTRPVDSSHARTVSTDSPRGGNPPCPYIPLCGGLRLLSCHLRAERNAGNLEDRDLKRRFRRLCRGMACHARCSVCGGNVACFGPLRGHTMTVLTLPPTASDPRRQMGSVTLQPAGQYCCFSPERRTYSTARGWTATAGLPRDPGSHKHPLGVSLKGIRRADDEAATGIERRR